MHAAYLTLVAAAFFVALVSGGLPPSNPLAGKTLYVNPSFKKDVSRSMRTSFRNTEKENLAIMRETASVYWLDVKTKVPSGNDSTTYTAEGILRDATSQSPVPLVSFIVYNLPNRDCHAKASNGEICCSSYRNPDGTCNYFDTKNNCGGGLWDYKTNYIDEIAKSISKYCDRVPIALIIEPDSLPNLITNRNDPKCGNSATQASYRTGVRYAVRTLSRACRAAIIYVDAAHGGWLGWENNISKFAQEIASLQIAHLIRGFSLNVANYQPLGIRCPWIGYCMQGRAHPCCKDPCALSTNYNPAHSELNYADVLHGAVRKEIPWFDPHMIIDTGRNARSPRNSCANWCNARGAGSGLLPTTRTAHPGVVDAYMWMKTPGESDGCTERLPDGKRCRRFDADCASVDSIGSRSGEPRSPEAGGWFDYQVKMLARNADFGI